MCCVWGGEASEVVVGGVEDVCGGGVEVLAVLPVVDDGLDVGALGAGEVGLRLVEPGGGDASVLVFLLDEVAGALGDEHGGVLEVGESPCLGDDVELGGDVTGDGLPEGGAGGLGLHAVGVGLGDARLGGAAGEDVPGEPESDLRLVVDVAEGGAMVTAEAVGAEGGEGGVVVGALLVGEILAAADGGVEGLEVGAVLVGVLA